MSNRSQISDSPHPVVHSFQQIRSPLFSKGHVLAVAIGSILVLGGFFLLLAAHQILPHGVNPISHWKIGAITVGSTMIGSGAIGVIAYGIIWAYFRKMPEPKRVDPIPVEKPIEEPRPLPKLDNDNGKDFPKKEKGKPPKNPLDPKVFIDFEQLDALIKFPVMQKATVDHLGPRTMLMENALKKDEGYDKTNKTLVIEGKKYQVVHASMNAFADNPLPLISCGASSSREWILFDPKQSPLLEAQYKLFSKNVLCYMIAKGNASISAEKLLMIACLYMQKIFPSSDDVDKKLEELIKQQKNKAIPIDLFIEKKLGVCRHHSLIVAYFLDRFIQHHSELCSFKGKVQIMRDNVSGGAHAWVTLVCKDGTIFTIDSLNEIIGNLNDETFKNAFAKAFGKEVVEHQLAKAKKLHAKYYPKN